jgi:hypothetical protein
VSWSGEVVWSGSVCLGARHANDIRKGGYMFDACSIETASR